MPDSSSTMRMLCMLSGNRTGNGFQRDRQFHDEPGANWTIFLDSNGTAMVLNDTADDSQPQPGSSFLSGEVWQKKPFLQFLCDAVAGIGDGDFYGISAGYQQGRDLNLTYQRALHSLSGVIYQIGQCALDRLRIRHHVGKIAGQECLYTNIFQPSIEHRQG